MPAKKIWIVSKYPWVATLRSENPNGDTGWFSLSKSSGEANYPAGEFIDVLLNNVISSFNKKGYVDVSSNSTTLTVTVNFQPTVVCTWNDFINVWKNTCRNAFSHAFSRAYNCTSPKPYLNVTPDTVWLQQEDIDGAQAQVESNTNWHIE
jgi:hypothetical protein